MRCDMLRPEGRESDVGGKKAKNYSPSEPAVQVASLSALRWAISPSSRWQWPIGVLYLRHPITRYRARPPRSGGRLLRHCGVREQEPAVDAAPCVRWRCADLGRIGTFNSGNYKRLVKDGCRPGADIAHAAQRRFRSAVDIKVQGVLRGTSGLSPWVFDNCGAGLALRR